METRRGSRLEIGWQAVWSLSSCKPGFGVSMLRDGCVETYWQSDGVQPHYVNIQFLKKTAVKTISLLLDHRQDESYTPSKLAVRVGSNFQDLTQIAVVEFTEPEGWVDIGLMGKNEKPVRAFLFQIVVLANHQNGRDAHIRQINIFEPEQRRTDGTTLQEFHNSYFGSMQFPI